MMTYTIPFVPPSLNKFAGRKNVWQYREEKQTWLQYAMVYCRPKPPQPFKRASVTIRYFFKTKARHDPDNYSGKMILDGLTQSGIITDDSFECIELTIKGGYDKANPRTEITVEEII